MTDWKYDLDVNLKEIQKLYQKRDQIGAALASVNREITGKEYLIGYLQSKVQEEDNGAKKDQQGT